MKLLVIAEILATICLLSCGNGSKQQTNKNVTASDSIVNYAGNNADSSNAAGARLIAAYDCLTCHKIKDTSIGPSYYSIAAKYHNDVGVKENLVHSIINGSTGIWGNKSMTPHRTLEYADARKMVLYILSLNDSTTNDNR